MLCSELAQKRNAGKRLEMLLLLHDASEAYLSDVSRPVKPLLSGYEYYEKKVQKIIFQALAIKEPSRAEQEVIEEIDLTMLATERKWLMMSNRNEWGIPYSPAREIIISECTPGYIEKKIIERFWELHNTNLFK